MKLHSCEHCRIRKYAEKKPGSWVARLWRWHTGWCPGWKAYQRDLATRNSEKLTPSNPG